LGLCTSILNESDLIKRFTVFPYNAKYFQTFHYTIWGEMAIFANGLHSMLKLRFTLHEVSWQFNNSAYSSGLMFGRIISTIAFRWLFSSSRLSKRTKLYWNSSKACFSNHTLTFCAILDKSCM